MNNNNRLSISVSPHIVTPLDTRAMMKGLVIGLIPCVISSIYFFKLRAVILIAVATATCVITEYLCRKIRHKEITIDDWSAAVTGVLLGLVMPPGIPLWMVVVGGVFAIAMTKEIFGGLGANIFNPALLSRAFLMAAFPVALTTWVEPNTFEAVTTATPLGMAKFNSVMVPYWNLFIGNVSGSLGETSALAVLIGAAYLLWRKIIDFRIPVAYALTIVVFSGIGSLAAPGKIMPPLFYLMAGGFLFGAIYMATDPVTSPTTKGGRWVFGIGCGFLTMVIRLWAGLPEGVMYSIILMNGATPIINQLARPRRYGTRRFK